jgi:pimeloyl-ACP methyl ester carboxylesterase
MGGIASIRHGALIGGTDAVVGISSLAYWDWHGDAHPRARRTVQAQIGTPAGRAALRAFGVRMPDRWDPPEAPEDVIGKIAPTPVLVVHGADDRLFPPSHARALYEAAGEPKRLLIGEGFGHAEDGLTPAFAHKLVDVLRELVAMCSCACSPRFARSRATAASRRPGTRSATSSTSCRLATANGSPGSPRSDRSW